MKDVSDLSVLIYDTSALFASLAERLARQVKRVRYFLPWQDCNPKINRMVIGDGLENVERVKRLWDAIKDSDFVIFPYIYDSDLQDELIRQGKVVFGTRRADELEYDRVKFLKTVEEVGLPVPKYTVIRGMSELIEHCKYNNDRYIKISEWRGMMETFHHINWQLSEPMLLGLAYELGPFGEDVTFVSMPPIKSKLETGYDGFCFDGWFPQTAAFYGYERKNLCYLMAVQDYSELPNEVSEVNTAFAPVLERYGVKGNWHTEIRVTEDDKPYFIDATPRIGSPSGECILGLIDNLAEFMYLNAQGIHTEPKLAGSYAAQAMMRGLWTGTTYTPISIPDKIRQWVHVYNGCNRNGIDYAVPTTVEVPEESTDLAGSIVGIGDTPKEAIQHLKNHCDQVKGFEMSNTFEDIAWVLREVEHGEAKGISFGNEPVPDAADILNEA